MAENSQVLDLPLKVKLSMSVLSFVVDMTRRANGTVNRFIMSLIDFKSPPSKKPINGVTSTDITVDKSRNLWFRLYTPSHATREATMPVIFYFHGGGFAYFSASSKPFDDFCYRLASELAVIIISVNYRLSPEHRYPAQCEDCFDTLKFIDETEFDGFLSQANLKHCFIAGDSAGGNIVHHVQLKAAKHEFRRIKLIGAILSQPFFGGEDRTDSEMRLGGKVPFVSIERTDWMWKAFLPEGSDRNHHAVNVFGPNSDDISELNFAASIVFVAGFDPLQDWQKRYYEDLKRCGKEVYLIEYPNTFHSFFMFPELKENLVFIKDLKEFVALIVSEVN